MEATDNFAEQNPMQITMQVDCDDDDALVSVYVCDCESQTTGCWYARAAMQWPDMRYFYSLLTLSSTQQATVVTGQPTESEHPCALRHEV